MKHLRSFGKALSLLTLAATLLASCEKQIGNEQTADRSGTSQQKAADVTAVAAVVNGTVVDPLSPSVTTPAGSVDLNVMYLCGRGNLEKGYVLDEFGGKVYKGASGAALQFESITKFDCTPSGFTVNETLEAGSYVYRARLQPTVPNNSPCAKSKCGAIKGVQTLTFTVVAE